MTLDHMTSVLRPVTTSYAAWRYMARLFSRSFFVVFNTTVVVFVLAVYPQTALRRERGVQNHLRATSPQHVCSANQ